jgi:hypothetical protein
MFIKHPPADVAELKAAFLNVICKFAGDYKIPAQLIINFDQTG